MNADQPFRGLVFFGFMSLIKVYNEIQILIDKEDIELVKPYAWHVHSSKGKSYVSHSYHQNGRTKRLLMHRLIMNAPQGLEVDHINGNGLDNRKSNLRLCTRHQNVMNRKVSKSNKIGLKGVSKTPYDRWVAQIQCNGKKIYLGVYKTPQEAAKAYKKAQDELFGDFANKGGLKAWA